MHVPLPAWTYQSVDSFKQLTTLLDQLESNVDSQ